MSYGELWERAGAVAADWHHDSLRAGEFVCILGFTSRDFTTIDLACLRSGATSVALQSSASAAQLRLIIGETEPCTLASSVELLDTALDAAAESSSLRRILVFDYLAQIDEQREVRRCPPAPGGMGPPDHARLTERRHRARVGPSARSRFRGHV
ncbi:AMP-binding protein [Streptomyces sp. PTM05]|uniref:AMP-binding protein n=1 Tax=Streptantibioticus parmotrematis TaxID=2873249 RepID=A0ABS7QUZ0_9ACTN|nr:AMP-binding protein [Streptantibioticus parmotrematis]